MRRGPKDKSARLSTSWIDALMEESAVDALHAMSGCQPSRVYTVSRPEVGPNILG